MSLSVNKCLIAGKVTDAGVRLTYGEDGTPEAYWTLMVDETGANGMTFTTFIPCRAWGKSAETIAEQMDAGDVVFTGDGKLKFRSWATKSGEKKTRLEVTTWAVQILKASAESVN